MLSTRIVAVGVVGPGLTGWAGTRAVLRGDAPFSPAPTAAPPVPAGLPPTERRRATRVVRLALAAADQALPERADPAMAAVFASGEGDMDTFDQICRGLATEPAWMSPHRFHNSVHNAPAGYWSIGAGCRGNGTSLAAGDDSFAAGLVEALTCLQDGDTSRCLLVVYDQEAPPVFRPVRPVVDPFAVALLLDTGAAGPRLTAASAAGATPDGADDPALERLRVSNPAARALPLLALLAREAPGRVVLPWGRAGLAVEVVHD